MLTLAIIKVAVIAGLVLAAGFVAGFVYGLLTLAELNSRADRADEIRRHPESWS